jgi:hypothetical protein
VKRGTMLLAVALIPLAAFLANAAPAERTVFAPAAVFSGTEFVAAYDNVGCTAKGPVVTWIVPGCVVTEGQGKATATIRCLGQQGTQIRVQATARGGRPAASCNGVATTSVVIAGGNAPAADVCPQVAGLPNQVELKARLAAAKASAPSDLLGSLSAASSVDPAAAFGGLAAAVRCTSPATHPLHPEKVSAAELRAWLAGTVLKGPLSGFTGLVTSLSDADLVWIYRRLTEASRHMSPGSLG